MHSSCILCIIPYAFLMHLLCTTMHAQVPAGSVGLLKKTYLSKTVLEVGASPDWDTDRKPPRANWQVIRAI